MANWNILKWNPYAHTAQKVPRNKPDIIWDTEREINLKLEALQKMAALETTTKILTNINNTPKTLKL